MKADEIRALWKYMTPAEQAEVMKILEADKAIWRPLPGPQSMAYYSKASVIGYGGAAGGGKTDLACGMALTEHQKTLVLRREGTQLTGILDRFVELLGSRDAYNGKDNMFRMPGRQIEFGSTPHADDWNKYQGRPHDLLIFDEAANFLEGQVRALIGWLRTTDPKQRCRALLAFNPPTNTEGRWIVEFFAPWIDRKHPNPALPGEIRYFATIAGRDVEVPDARQFVLIKGERIYEFVPTEHQPTEIIQPMSRTFIPSRITDNPYLYGTGYMSTLQALPEPLRSQMLNGDFAAGMKDDAFQVIPTAWVDAAMARWVKPDKLPEMDEMGVDVARGGEDETVIARRHGAWFDEPIALPGTATPDGPTVAGQTVAARRDSAPVNIDVIGVGASPFDFLQEMRVQVLGVNVSESPTTLDQSGQLEFFNLRTQIWWQFREFLDPANNTGAALPPSKRLAADLCAPLWKMSGSKIQVEGREAIKQRTGRSPDYASAYLLANMQQPKRGALGWGVHQKSSRQYNPFD